MPQTGNVSVQPEKKKGNGFYITVDIPNPCQSLLIMPPGHGIFYALCSWTLEKVDAQVGGQTTTKIGEIMWTPLATM